MPKHKEKLESRKGEAWWSQRASKRKAGSSRIERDWKAGKERLGGAKGLAKEKQDQAELRETGKQERRGLVEPKGQQKKARSSRIERNWKTGKERIGGAKGLAKEKQDQAELRETGGQGRLA